MKDKIRIKKEVLRYLGYKDQKIDLIIDTLIEDSIEEMEKLIEERYIYKSFHISKDEKGLYLLESNLYLPGHAIAEHLSKSKTCILMAVSLGHEVDRRIRYYEKTNMTRALILDACGTTFIEEICDRICREIESNLINNEKLTSRFSPGYGDLPINIQKDFLATLNAEKSIGLTATSSSILIPRKSVTAIVGVVVDKYGKTEENACILCNNYSNCKFTKGGNLGGY